jgi:proteasome assembly chaperone (PAC2) family protein
MVAAFEGWNDAGDAATAATTFLQRQWDARLFAELDPEDFYDFTVTRPRVDLDEGVTRRIVWPANEFLAAEIPGTDRDVVIFRGVEPQLKWRTYCGEIIGVASALGIEMVLTLGALLAEVPHSRPVSVFGAAYDDVVAAELGLTPSSYEGPTGIVGVLHAACHDAGMRSASFWAAVPTYVPAAPSPKAALALVARTATLLHTSVDTTELEIASASYERQVSELVEEDDETSEWVASLEQRFDDEAIEFPSGTSIAEEVEKFLREQRD